MCHLLPHVQQCCCGCQLLTGARSLAGFFLAISVMTSITAIGNVAMNRTDSDLYERCRQDTCVRRSSEECVQDCFSWKKAQQGVHRYGMVFALAGVISCIALFVGVYRGVPAALLVFAYGYSVALCGHTLVSLAMFAAHGVAAGWTAVVVVVYLLWWMLTLYLCVVVVSLYRTMVDPDQYPRTAIGVVVYAGPPNYPQQGGAGPYPQYPPGLNYPQGGAGAYPQYPPGLNYPQVRAGAYPQYPPGQNYQQQGGAGAYPQYPPGQNYPQGGAGPNPKYTAGPNYPGTQPLNPQTGAAADATNPQQAWWR